MAPGGTFPVQSLNILRLSKSFAFKVITYPPDLESSQIVSISAYITPSTPSSVDTTTSSGVRLSYPLAVGSMVIPSSSLTNTSKGKVVDVLHAYGDHLWSIGGKREPPSEGLPFGRAGSDVGKDENQGDDKAAEADTEAQTIEKLASEVVDRTDDFEGRDDLREGGGVEEPPRTPSPSPSTLPTQPDLSPQGSCSSIIVPFQWANILPSSD